VIKIRVKMAGASSAPSLQAVIISALRPVHVRVIGVLLSGSPLVVCREHHPWFRRTVSRKGSMALREPDQISYCCDVPFRKRLRPLVPAALCAVG